MSKEIWVKADTPDKKEKRKELVISALECGVTVAIVRPEDKDFTSFGNVKLIFNDNGKLSDDSVYVELKKPADQEGAMALAGKCKTVVLGTSDWTIIPLENMIAKFHKTDTRIFACASSVEKAKTYLTTLEKGVDGIVIDVSTGNEVRQFADLSMESSDVNLVPLKVLDVKKIEMGDRVCVDTVSMMRPGEGMLIGSTASCLFLIQSESEDNGYVNARPFRVNAGAVHAYVLGPEGKTRYLSELKSGETILLVDKGGKTRISSVGRCKIEQRPMLILEATDGKEKYTTILQNAETVKLVGPKGSISVSKIKTGDEVYARLESGGRHFGMKIDETIREL
ncbi:MAG: 3-dehydroquinate synthase II [Candidatus Methanogranum gryphiswaldense]|nr:MAG: 3-dehydroquinate synthase II [Candidatus Methanogranum sp. U3.2.1]